MKYGVKKDLGQALRFQKDLVNAMKMIVELRSEDENKTDQIKKHQRNYDTGE